MDYGSKTDTVILPERTGAREYIRPAVSLWLVIFTILVLACLLVACYFPMLIQTGRTIILSDDMAYGFFAPIVAVYVAWGKRAAVLNPIAGPSPWSVVLIGLGACVGTVSTLANSSTFSRFAFLISLAGCLLLLGGWA